MKPLEIVLTILLGLGLTAAGWRDWQSTRRDRPGTPEYDFLRPVGEGVPRTGEAEFHFHEAGLVALDGVSGIENLGEGPFRHGVGPATRLLVRSNSAREAVLSFRFHNGVEHQDLIARYDGQPLETFKDLSKDMVERTFRLPLKPGSEHVFALEYARWNHHGADLAPEDDRQIAGSFSQLEVSLEGTSP